MSDVPSALMRQTLMDRELVRPATQQPVIRLLPWLDVVVVGGHSILDRGRDAVLPVVEELRGLLLTRRMLVLTGAGIRGRHVMSVGYDLGLPTGVVAGLAATEAEQNGKLVAALLAAEGVSYLPHATVAHQLAAHLAAAPAAVSSAFPPYGRHEFPGPLPVHRSDAGAYLLADAYGARSLVYVKDRDSDDPGAGVDELVPQLMSRGKHVRQARVVNGLVPGQISAALDGKDVGVLLQA